MSPPRQPYDKLISLLIFVGSLAFSLGVFFIPLNPQQLSAYGYGGVFIVTLLGAATLFLPAPTMVATFMLGALLDPLLVSLVAGAGSALGETTGYLAGYASRALLRPREERKTWYWRVFHWMSTHPFLTIFLMDAVPNFVGDVAGLIAGRMSYPYYKFLLASFLGKSIRFGLSAYLGFGLRRLGF